MWSLGLEHQVDRDGDGAGEGLVAVTFDTAAQNAYWYTDITYPTGQDDASIVAGNYTLNMHFGTLPAAQSWWDTNYTTRKQLTVSAGSSSIPADYPVRLEFDHASLTPAQSLASGDDIRIAYFNGATWSELDRALFDDGITSSSWDSATSTIMFKTVASISASGSRMERTWSCARASNASVTNTGRAWARRSGSPSSGATTRRSYGPWWTGRSSPSVWLAEICSRRRSIRSCRR